RGRNPLPNRVRFTTWTLRYNQAFWVTVDELDQHWERARVDARFGGNFPPNADVSVRVDNVAAFTLAMPPRLCPFDPARKPRVRVTALGGNRPGPEDPLEAAPVLTDRSWTAHFRKVEGKWQAAASADTDTLRKRPGLQGPIDDAFMDRFLMV